MKMKKIITACMIIGFFLCSTIAMGSDSAKIKWLSYNEGVSLGEKQNKKIFVTFYASWCHFCKKMDKETFSDGSVVDYLTSNYIPVRIDTDKEKKLASKFHVSGLPTHMFLSEKGEIIGSQPGYISANQFLPLLKYVATNSYQTMKLQDFIKAQKK